MNIAFLTPEYVTETGRDGGLANYLYKISTALVEKGHHVFVIVNSTHFESFHHNGVNIVRVSKESRPLDILRKTPLRSFRQPLSWILQSFRLNSALRKLIASQAIDVVQYASYTAVGLASPAKLQSVVRISSYQPYLDRGYERSSTLATRLCARLERRALKRATLLYCPSKFLADIVSEELQREVTIIETPLAPAVNADHSTHLSLLADKSYLLYFGTLGVLKGVKEIGEILPALFERYPDLYFVFAGKDTVHSGESMKQSIEAMTREYPGRCVFPGSLPQPHLQPIIASATMIVLPSRVDNFPNTCIEAMSQGKIVVASRGASFEQLIDDGDNGFLCEASNSTSLLKTIVHVFNLDEKERARVESNAMRSVERLAPEKIVRQVEQLFEKAINS